MPDNLVLSAPVIMAPEPTSVTSDKAVTLDVVYTPFVTVAALPVISLMIAVENVFAPSIVWSPDVITAPAANTLVASVTSAAVSIPDNLVLSAPVIIAPEPTSVTSDNAVTLDVVYTPLVTVAALPEMLAAIVDENVFSPAIVWSPDVITAPAANTLVASVTSAEVSIPDNFVRSAPVIMAPDPTSVTSDNAVTLEVVYTPLVTVAAFPEMLPAIVDENVFAPSIVWLPDVITAPAANTFVASVTSAEVSISDNFVRSALVIMAPEPTSETSDNAVTLDVVYTPLVTVAALPVISLIIAVENVFAPAMVWSPDVITPPEANTFVASVTSADVSIPNNLVRSALVIIAPEPTSETSDNAVTLDVVYTPLVTVAALPVISLIIAVENVFAPSMVWLPDVITAPAANTFVASVTSAAVSIPDNFVRSALVIMAPEPTSETSDNAVTLEVVYTPLVTVAALPVISLMIADENVFAPAMV